jgi:peptide/nickel transport system substrate-binding protein
MSIPERASNRIPPTVERLAEAGRTGRMDRREFLAIASAMGLTTTAAYAIAAQMREVGSTVKRTVLPGSSFWNDWIKYTFSLTIWNRRPLGVQVLALAYHSGEAWNETGFADRSSTRSSHPRSPSQMSTSAPR